MRRVRHRCETARSWRRLLLQSLSSFAELDSSKLFCLGMIFSENRIPPIGSWPEGMLFGIMPVRRLFQARVSRVRVVDHDLAHEIRGHSFRQHRVAVELPVRIVGRE